MKRYFFALAAFAALFTACQGNKSEQATTDTSALDTNIVSTTPQHCYQYIKNRDTAKLSFMTSGTITTGELSYHFAEKDSNKGIIKGEMRGDTLIADYTFSSEGKESVRQVAFLKKGDQMLEGFGDVLEKDGKMIFKDLHTLKFGQPIIFDKTDCH